MFTGVLIDGVVRSLSYTEFTNFVL